jgi:hypothetical protein
MAPMVKNGKEFGGTSFAKSRDCKISLEAK